MKPPKDKNLPFFVYGALKPGMPAFEPLRPFVGLQFERDSVNGALYVRDGLPLLKFNEPGIISSVSGFRLHFKSGKEEEGYAAACEFEPPKHYQWVEEQLKSGARANLLLIRYPTKGNPQPLFEDEWRISYDPAFGSGLEAVEDVVAEIDPGLRHMDSWSRFFRAQMAYLLLWSILERLSALCFGPGQDPMARVGRLHKLRGIADLVANNVQRADQVSDSRNPDATFKLDASDARKSFAYYYQLRSNLSHRGKGVENEFPRVYSSLRELLEITKQYLHLIQDQEGQV